MSVLPNSPEMFEEEEKERLNDLKDNVAVDKYLTTVNMLETLEQDVEVFPSDVVSYVSEEESSTTYVLAVALSRVYDILNDNKNPRVQEDALDFLEKVVSYMRNNIKLDENRHEGDGFEMWPEWSEKYD